MQTYAQAWQELRERCDAPAFTSRNYLPTRVRALREHLDYARAELLKLPSSPGDPAFTSAHSHFYRTLRYLEAAFAQAENELNEGV